MVLDFNSNLIVQYIPQIDFCQKFNMPFKNLNIKQIMEEYADPSTGLLENLGVQTVPWTGAQAYAWKANSYFKELDDTQILYFSLQS